jgi:hypothetical protein
MNCDYGHAFPVWELNGQGKPEMTGFGLSTRDYFAAKALQGMLTGADITVSDEVLAREAYKLADAMMIERSKG